MKVGEEVEIVGLVDEKKKTVVTGLEMFHKLLDFAQAGDNVGALLRGIQRTEIERGQVLAKPGTIHPHRKFTGQVYVLKKEEGGRHTPFFNNYRPQFYFRTTDVTGVITLPEGTEMCMPGDNVTMDVELITPDRHRRGPALRYPRRRPHGGFRRCDEDQRVIFRFSKCPMPLAWGGSSARGRRAEGRACAGRKTYIQIVLSLLLVYFARAAGNARPVPHARRPMGRRCRQAGARRQRRRAAARAGESASGEWCRWR